MHLSGLTTRIAATAAVLLCGFACEGCITGGLAAYLTLSSEKKTGDNVPPTVVWLNPVADDEDAFNIALTYEVTDEPGSALVLQNATFRVLNAAGPVTTGTLTSLSNATSVGIGDSMGPVSGAPQTVRTVWDSLTDIQLGNGILVEVTLVVSDGGSVTTSTSDAFFVSNGPLAEETSHPTLGIRPDGITVGEVDGDAQPDIITCGAGDQAGGGFVLQLLNTGQSFAPASLAVGTPPLLPGVPGDPAGAGTATNFGVTGNMFWSRYARPSECAFLDTDGDGREDLVYANSLFAPSSFVDLLTNVPQILADAGADGVAFGFQSVLDHQRTFTARGTPAAGLDFSGAYESAQAPGNLGYFIQDLVAADLDGPGAPGNGSKDLVIVHGIGDLALAPGDLSGCVVIRQVDTGGTLTPNTFVLDRTVMGDLPTHCAVGDITRDGRPDIVVACPGNNTLTIYVQTAETATPGTAPPTFSGHNLDVDLFDPFTSRPGGDIDSLALGDIDGDGFNDLVVVGSQSKTVSVLLGDTNATAPFSLLPLTAGEVPLRRATTLPDTSVLERLSGRPALADVTGDGAAELLLPNLLLNELLVFVNTTSTPSADPFSVTPVRLTTQFQPFDVVIADLNGDPSPNDAAVACAFTRSVSVLYQANPGTFKLDKPVTIPSGVSPFLMDHGDIALAGPTGPVTEERIAVSLNGENGLSVLSRDPSQLLRETVRYDLGQPGTDPFSGLVITASVPVFPRIVDATGNGENDLLAALEVTSLNEAGLELVTAPLDSASTSVDLISSAGAPIGFAVDAGDFLGNDGIPDLVLSLHEGGQDGGVALYQGLAGGGYLAPVFRLLPGEFPAKVVVADVDGDGLQDLVVGNERPLGNAPLFIYYNGGHPAGSLPAGQIPGTPESVPLGPGVSQSVGLAVANLAGDPLLDIAVSGFSSNTVGYLVQGPARTFTQVALTAGTSPGQVAVGDLNGDGLVDLAVPWLGDDALAVYFQNPAGGFFGPTRFDCPAGSAPVGVVIMDVDLDGANDAVVSARGANALLVFLQR